jgi:MFS family permease
MLCTLTSLVVVPLWGWRGLYFIGIVPALLVFWVWRGIKESPRFEHVTTAMLTEGLKKRLDILSPARDYPRDMLIASLVYFFYLFTWIGWSAWMPFFLSSEKHLGFQTTSSYLSIWMFVAIFSYWFCGWLCDTFGRRIVIPVFVIPAALFLVILGQLTSASSLFWVGLVTNFLITGSFGTGLGYTAELFPTQIRGTAVGASFTFGTAGASFAPMILGIIANHYSISAGLPLLALSFFLLAPLFFWFARDVTRKDLTDFVGQHVGETKRA